MARQSKPPMLPSTRTRRLQPRTNQSSRQIPTTPTESSPHPTTMLPERVHVPSAVLLAGPSHDVYRCPGPGRLSAPALAHMSNPPSSSPTLFTAASPSAIHNYPPETFSTVRHPTSWSDPTAQSTSSGTAPRDSARSTAH